MIHVKFTVMVSQTPSQIQQELVLQLRLLQLGDHPGDFLRRAPEPPALEVRRVGKISMEVSIVMGVPQ